MISFLKLPLRIHTPIPRYTSWAGIVELTAAKILKEFYYVIRINIHITINIRYATLSLSEQFLLPRNQLFYLRTEPSRGVAPGGNPELVCVCVSWGKSVAGGPSLGKIHSCVGWGHFPGRNRLFRPRFISWGCKPSLIKNGARASLLQFAIKISASFD